MATIKQKQLLNYLNRNQTILFYGFFIIIFLFQVIKVFTFSTVSPDSLVTTDGEQYIGALENLITDGKYHFEGRYAGRMPGFFPIYVPLRLILPYDFAIVLSYYVQLLFFAFSVVFFTRQVQEYFNLNMFFFIALCILIGLSDYITTWAKPFYTETLGTSSALVGFAFYLKAIKEKSTKYFILSGLFMTWMVFLRPFLIVVWVLFSIAPFFVYRDKLKSKLLYFFYFCLSFVIIDSIWIFRNYPYEQKIVPLQSSLYAGIENLPGYLKLRDFVSGFGGDRVKWHPGSAKMWFQTDEYLDRFNFTRPEDDIIPDWVLNNELTLDSLKSVRKWYWISIDTSVSESKRVYADSMLLISMEGFIDNMKSENPFRFHIMSRVQILSMFIIQPYTYYLPLNDGNLRHLQFAFKAFIYSINAFVIFFGFLAMCILFLRLIINKFDYILFLFFTIPGFIILYFPVIRGTTEYRFIVTAYPFLAFFITYLVYELIKKFLLKREVKSHIK